MDCTRHPGWCRPGSSGSRRMRRRRRPGHRPFHRRCPDAHRSRPHRLAKDLDQDRSRPSPTVPGRWPTPRRRERARPWSRRWGQREASACPNNRGCHPSLPSRQLARRSHRPFHQHPASRRCPRPPSPRPSCLPSPRAAGSHHGLRCPRRSRPLRPRQFRRRCLRRPRRQCPPARRRPRHCRRPAGPHPFRPCSGLHPNHSSPAADPPHPKASGRHPSPVRRAGRGRPHPARALLPRSIRARRT